MKPVEFKKVSVVGLGYIGLPTAAVLASRGVDITGVDVSPTVVETINQGNIHIVEPGLDMVVRAAVNSNKLRAVTRPEPSDVFLIAVPTPFKEPDHKPDLSYIEAVAKSIAPVLQKGNLIILESTSPVGTTEQLSQWLSAQRPDLLFPSRNFSNADVSMAYCPERVLPGQVLKELVDNDRVIGGMTPKCAERAMSFYKIFVEGECILSDARTAEMVKLTENAFRDVNIAFANELSLICDDLGINVWKLIELANRHPRVNVLKPGSGVGGHCIAVDPWFIVDRSPEQAKLIKQARLINDFKSQYVLDKVKSKASELRMPQIACLGVAFKPDIDDLRESPALWIAEQLVKGNVGNILVVEPNISELPESLKGFDHVRLCSTEEALATANLVVGLVKHRSFSELSRESLREKIVLDFVNIFES